MKFMDILLRKPSPDPKVNKAFSVASTVLTAAAIAYISYFFSFPIPVAAVSAVSVVALLFVLKPHKLLSTPLTFHLIGVLLSAYLTMRFLSFVKSSGVKSVFISISIFLGLLFLSELVLYILVSLLMDEPHPKRFFKSFVSVFALLFTMLVYIPSETFFNNFKDFDFCYVDFAPYFFIVALVISILAALVMCEITEKLYHVFCCVFCGLLLGVYCQCTFMNKDLSAVIGEKMDWAALKTRSIINAFIWIGLMILPFVIRFVCKHIKALGSTVRENSVVFVSGFIGAMQLLSIVIMMFTTQASLYHSSKYMLTAQEQFVVSKNKNVITFIIDMADQKFFEKALDENPEKFECLKDFTCYTNTCMVYDSTALSIPQMLSGTTKLPEDNLDKWLSETWSEDPCKSFYSRLHENNYKVNVFGNFAHSYDVFKDSFDNVDVVEPSDIKVNRYDLLSDVDQMSLYRWMPLGLKKHFEPDQSIGNRAVMINDQCIMDNKEYLSKLDLKTSDDDKNYFIVEHLNGTHMIEKHIADETNDCLDILNKYIAQLKTLGVYDDSVIIITADHGEHYAFDDMPIWYIKPAGAHGTETQTCSAPIWHTDYVATCLDTAGLLQDGEEELFGRSIYQIDENEQRQRLVFQRSQFSYTGKVNFKRYSEASHPGALFGYYFTGTKEDLVKHEENDPPDVLIELDSPY